ncbi:MAG: TIGR00269 family protein [Candidatus Nanohalarchaeota archaeon]|nr:MAG: TIGR00269 family protein [Candidatus Nanohaloarchaeota archaeon]
MPKCSFCDSKAIIVRKYEGIALCEKHFLRSVEKKIRKTIRVNQLLKHNDTVAVGLSGGKDSSLLCWFLSSIRKRYNIKLIAITIDEGIGAYRKENIKCAKMLAKKYGVEHRIFSFREEVGMTLNQIMKKKAIRNENRSACSVCSVLRRYILNKKARELGANKLAIGHNLDDECQSIFISYIRGDIPRALRLGPMSLGKENIKFIKRIKPLIEIPEKETALFSALKGFKTSFGECPNAKTSFRWKIRDILLELEDGSPGTRFSIAKNFEKIKASLVKTQGKKTNPMVCKKCKEPASNEYCKYCTIMKLTEK